MSPEARSSFQRTFTTKSTPKSADRRDLAPASHSASLPRRISSRQEAGTGMDAADIILVVVTTMSRGWSSKSLVQ